MREIERRIAIVASTDISNMKIPERPVGELDDFDKQVDLLFDLIAIAYQADLTRVASFVMVAEGTNQTYNHIGVPDSFHPDLAPCQRSGPASTRWSKIQTWHMDRFAAFLQKMARHEGRRRLAAGSLDLPVWIEHGQQRQAQQLADSRPSSSAAATAR